MGLVYYYCGAKAFENITKNKQLWLSDVTQSNDKDELIWYAEIIKKHFDDLFDKVLSIRGNFDNIKSRMYFKSQIKTILMQNICFGMCFSELGDDLSQWRGYGDDGMGYAIGFDEDIIKTLAINKCLTYKKVLYRDNWDITQEEKEKDKERINKIFSKLDKDCGIWLDLRKYYNYEIKRILPTVAYYKNSAFKAEREHRLYLFDKKVNAYSRDDLAIHFSPSGFIPHLEINFDKELPLIKEIIIGPTNSGNIEALQQYCNKIFDYRVIVKESSLHYKGKN